MRVELGSGVIPKKGITVINPPASSDAVAAPLVGQAPGRIDQAEMIRRAGRLAWQFLHEYVGCDPQWFKLWTILIPRGCECEEAFAKIVVDFPPDFSSDDAFWVWGVMVHNLVNEKLIKKGDTTKRIIPIDEARFIWNRAA
jgi:hypothetical protein